MANYEIFYAVCELFNEGQTTVKAIQAMNVIEAARLALPEFHVCAGLYDADTDSQILYVDNYAKHK